MIKQLKNVECFAPWYMGKKDITIVKDVIYKISPPGISNGLTADKVYDLDGMNAFPGIIDGHVHMIGGGGEDGPLSRIAEIGIEEFFLSGITTAVGLLGADNRTKSLYALYAKARALQLQGLTTYIYTGSYELPPVTFTGSVTDDLLLIDKVIGVGEVAISDVRSSYPDIEQMLKLSSHAYMGGLLSGKAGIVHLHVGDGSGRIDILEELLKMSDFPKRMFLPTHINRNAKLFEAGLQYARQGGSIDLTSGEKQGLAVPDAIEKLISSGVSLQNVTVSSDANASTPQGGVCSINTLYDDIKQSIIAKKIDPSAAFSVVTENVAKALKLYPQKGVLRERSDADILITDKEYNIQLLFSSGKTVINNGKIIKGA